MKLCLVSGIRKLTRTPEPETPQATTSVKFVPGQRTPETPQATTSVKFVPGQRNPETPQATTSVKFVPGPRTPETPQATTAAKFVSGQRTPETPQATTSFRFSFCFFIVFDLFVRLLSLFASDCRNSMAEVRNSSNWSSQEHVA
ncbi:hypothetical protein Bbelb_317890 [Branchiostoma belcheri]|nr:hypothetical protein Bbelb_317890 [Branchiostoma belcheri]